MGIRLIRVHKALIAGNKKDSPTQLLTKHRMTVLSSIIVYEFYKHNSTLLFSVKYQFIYPNDNFVPLKAYTKTFPFFLSFFLYFFLPSFLSLSLSFTKRLNTCNSPRKWNKFLTFFYFIVSFFHHLLQTVFSISLPSLKNSFSLKYKNVKTRIIVLFVEMKEVFFYT